jgi:UDP-glucose 4-epimerase
MAPPRPGDPARIIAGSERIRDVLGWRPQLDDLTTIARHALEWERRLAARNDPTSPPPIVR